MVNSGIKEFTQKRFTAVHELGHFENEKALTQPLTKGEEIFRKCGFDEFWGTNRNAKREAAANAFAAELLMHEPWFVNYVKYKK